MRKALSLAWFSLVRVFRERANLFFVLAFPLLIIWILGSQFGGDEARQVGLSGGGALADRVAQRLDDGGALEVRRVDGRQELADLVERGTLLLGVVVPGDAEERLRNDADVELTVILGDDDQAPQYQAVVSRAVTAETVVPTVTGQLASASGLPPDEVTQAVARISGQMSAIDVDREVVGGGSPGDEQVALDQVAVGMLLLMTFLNTLTGASALIRSRRYGISRRMMATPTSVGTIILGEALGRWGLGLLQAVYIMVASTLVFEVDWGHLPTAIAVVALFAAVAAGGAMLIGSVMRNDEQAAGVTVMAGLALGAFGGTMLPLDLFGSTMRVLAHVTPHAWAVDAFDRMAQPGATVLDVLPQLAVLAGLATVLMGLAVWRLRLTLTRL